MSMETNIPFAGLYDSIWDREIDNLEEREVENMTSEEGDWQALEAHEVQEVLFKHTDHGTIHKAIGKMYVEAWTYFINSELDLDIKLAFSIMTSPREYNFTTDRVFANITRSDIAKVYRKVGRQRLRAKAEEMFTSRSGFISYYSPNVENWGPVREWDYNQLGCLMEALGDMAGTESDNTWAIYDLLQEQISNTYDDNVDWPAVERDLQHLIDVENGGAVEDARKFPAGSVTSVHEYNRRFLELNHLKGAE